MKDQALWNRRDFMKAAGLGSAAALSAGVAGAAPVHVGPDPAPFGARAPNGLITIDPTPRFELSPYLYMQFMEPLGVTDSSVDAAWDFVADSWREDVVEATRSLSPVLLRWGGCFASYYRWREGVGPRASRAPMINLLWGGLYNNQVGTGEFVDFCRAVGADPLFVINFESDGRRGWASPRRGGPRAGDAGEAAAWVAYCNNPGSAERIAHGHKTPYAVKLWQIGNETSYDAEGFTMETAARKTLEFARAMHRADPSVRLIGWGDSGWAERMAEVAGEELAYIAFHNGFGPGGEESPLRGLDYRKDPDRTWEFLMKAPLAQEKRIAEMRTQVSRSGLPLALTECHFGLPGRNRNEVLSSWAAGVADAAVMNVHERNGDVLKISTLADFCGTRWMNNALMIPVPGGRPFLMPVGMMMSLYRKHVGTHGVDAAGGPDGLDVAASRSGDRLFLHVVNTSRRRAARTRFAARGMKIGRGRIFWHALPPELEITEYREEYAVPREQVLDPLAAWEFPAASVSAVEIEVTSE